MKTAHGAVRTAAVGITATLICPADPNRVALVFSAPLTGAANGYTVSTDPAVSVGEGLNLSPAGNALELCQTVHGDAVSRAWYAVASSGITIAYLETVAG